MAFATAFTKEKEADYEIRGNWSLIQRFRHNLSYAMSLCLRDLNIWVFQPVKVQMGGGCKFYFSKAKVCICLDVLNPTLHDRLVVEESTHENLQSSKD